jgi:chitinase
MRIMTAALLAACQLLWCGAVIAAPPSLHGRIVGYATRWDAAGDKDLGKIDTLIFAFAQVIDGRVVLDTAATDRLHTLIALRAAHPALKVAISVGGWGAGGFSEAAGSAAGRQAFADSAAQLLTAQDADGLDVDWEYPEHGEAGIRASPEDRANFTRLLQALRAALDRAGAIHGRAGARHFTLSIAAADGPFVSGIDIAAVSPYLDWFNLMTYDFVNSLTLHRSPQRPLAASTARGAPRSAVRQLMPRARKPGSAPRPRTRIADVVPTTRVCTSTTAATKASSRGRSCARPTSAKTAMSAIGIRRRRHLGFGMPAPGASSAMTIRNRSRRRPPTSRHGTWAASCTGSRVWIPAASC